MMTGSSIALGLNEGLSSLQSFLRIRPKFAVCMSHNRVTLKPDTHYPYIQAVYTARMYEPRTIPGVIATQK